MNRTVLLVEDADHIAPLELALTGVANASILILPDGREALAAIHSPSLELAALITDLHLPYVDGFELIRAVRRESRYVCLPIIVISGDPDPSTPALVQNLGADAFFVKPYSPMAVRILLEDLLNAK